MACCHLVPKFAGSHLAEAVGFLGRKNPQHAFGGEVKPSVPCRSFTACKRSLNITWKSAFRQNYRTFLAHIFTFRRWVLSRGDTRGDAWWRKFGKSNPDRTISLKRLQCVVEKLNKRNLQCPQCWLVRIAEKSATSLTTRSHSLYCCLLQIRNVLQQRGLPRRLSVSPLKFQYHFFSLSSSSSC